MQVGLHNLWPRAVLGEVEEEDLRLMSSTLAESTQSPVRFPIVFQNVADRLATADADPLGVDMNVTFDNVGGLDNRKLPKLPFDRDLS